MNKSGNRVVFIALGMSAMLFIYGYALSMAGHDHDHHEKVASEEELHNDVHDHHH